MKSFSKVTKKVTDFVLKNFYDCDDVNDNDTIVIKRIDFGDDLLLYKQDILNLITNSVTNYINFSFNVPIPYDTLEVIDNAFKMETCKVTLNGYDIIFLIDDNILIYVVKHNNNMKLLSSELVKFLTNLEKNIHHYKILGEYIYINSDIFSSNNMLRKELNVLEIEEETMSTSLKTHNVLTN